MAQMTNLVFFVESFWLFTICVEMNCLEGAHESVSSCQSVQDNFVHILHADHVILCEKTSFSCLLWLPWSAHCPWFWFKDANGRPNLWNLDFSTLLKLQVIWSKAMRQWQTRRSQEMIKKNYQNQLDTFLHQCLLYSVLNKAHDFLLQNDWCLSNVCHQLVSSGYDFRWSPGRRNQFHQWHVSWRIYLKRNFLDSWNDSMGDVSVQICRSCWIFKPQAVLFGILPRNVSKNLQDEKQCTGFCISVLLK